SEKTTRLPIGLSHVGFRTNRSTSVNVIAGFLGVSQDRDTGQLAPKPGWAVSRRTRFETLLDNIPNRPNVYVVPADSMTQRVAFGTPDCPQLQEFYDRFSSITVNTPDGSQMLKILERSEMEKRGGRGWKGRLHTFATLSDGSMIGIRLFMAEMDPAGAWRGTPVFACYFTVEDESELSLQNAALLGCRLEETLDTLTQGAASAQTLKTSFKILARINLLKPSLYEEIREILKPSQSS
ncbi:MAG: hypothetical protein KDA85_10010, partial [Planctomycetaceae bacterium]|nr:hypothetical protein [Planctomycetaceae bacterium]